MFQATISDAELSVDLIHSSVHRFGRIDVLVNNVGKNINCTMKKLSVEYWDYSPGETLLMNGGA